MKIGIVCYPTFGGSGVVATELGMALADKGHEIHFITYNQPVRLDFISHHLHFHQVLLEEYPLFQYQPYELALSSKIVEVVEKYHLEVLHVHYAIPHASVAYLAQQILKSRKIKATYITIPVLFAGLITTVVLETTGIFGFGQKLPEVARTIIEHYTEEEDLKRTHKEKWGIKVQAVSAILLIIGFMASIKILELLITSN